jgi:hypothetical protein
MSDFDISRLEILDECLTQIQHGEASVLDCLNAHPHHQEYLKSNLEVALHTYDLLAPPQPSEGFTSQAGIRLMNLVRAKQARSQTVRKEEPKRRLGFLRPSFAYVALLIAFVLLTSGLGVASASASALPGDLLYGVKLGIEDTRLAFSQGAPSDAKLLLQFADRRIEEIVALAEVSRIEDMDLALSEYDDLLTQIIDLTEEDELIGETETLDKIHFGLEHHEDVLNRVLENAPPAAVKGLENALERSGRGKTKIEKIKEGDSPSDQAPGQQDKDKETDKDKDKENESGNQGNPPADRGGGQDKK